MPACPVAAVNSFEGSALHAAAEANDEAPARAFLPAPVLAERHVILLSPVDGDRCGMPGGCDIARISTARMREREAFFGCGSRRAFLVCDGTLHVSLNQRLRRRDRLLGR